MPTLSSKLAQLRKLENVKAKEEEMATLTLEEMEKEVVEFGKQKGKTFAEAFLDDSWSRTWWAGRTSSQHPSTRSPSGSWR